MSVTLVRQILEQALAAASLAIATQYENGPIYVPVLGVPYQRCTILFAKPDNTEFGASYGEQGFMQVDLAYPDGAGTVDANARADVLRTTFKRTASFSASGLVVNIMNTPEVFGPGQNTGDRYMLALRIPFSAQIIV